VSINNFLIWLNPDDLTSINFKITYTKRIQNIFRLSDHLIVCFIDDILNPQLLYNPSNSADMVSTNPYFRTM
jgi:hypothetical protein